MLEWGGVGEVYRAKMRNIENVSEYFKRVTIHRHVLLFSLVPYPALLMMQKEFNKDFSCNSWSSCFICTVKTIRASISTIRHFNALFCFVNFYSWIRFN